MTTTDNLWPEFSLDEVIRSPKMILNEQAEFLAKGTKNLLTGNIRVAQGRSDTIYYYFEVIAPNLDGYVYTLFYLTQEGVFFYPCKLNFRGFSYEIETEELLIQKLKDVFNDESTKKIIGALLAQSKSESPA